MKLVTYRHSGNGAARVGVWEEDRVVSAANLLASIGEDPASAARMTDVIQLPGAVLGKLARAAAAATRAPYSLPVDDVQLLAPIPKPSKVIGLGYNYHALCNNEGVEPTPEPELFTKMPTSITGPTNPVMVPQVIDKVDFEAELGVVIGHPCRNVDEADALRFVAGYTVVNDVTAKIIPRPPESGSVVLALKGPDTFAPTGPCLLTSDDVPDPQRLNLLCRVNGEEKQNFDTSDMVHTVAAIVSYLSQRITLEPGDVITTGTSLGIGIVQKPPAFLADGDVVECEVSPIGTIRNRFQIPALRG